MNKQVFWLPVIVFLMVLVFFGIRTMQHNATPQKGVVDQTLGFHLPDLYDGKFFSNTDLQGEWSVVNIWASWCPPCLKEHPVLVEISETHPVAMYGINFKDDMDNAKAWLAEKGNPYRRTLVDLTGRAAFDLGVVGVPETILIDPNGVVQHRFAGIMTHEIWQTQFLPLIEANP